MGAEVRRRTPGVKQGLQVLTRRTGFGLASTVGADRASGGCAATEISRAVRVRGWVWTREGARAWREGGCGGRQGVAGASGASDVELGSHIPHRCGYDPASERRVNLVLTGRACALVCVLCVCCAVWGEREEGHGARPQSLSIAWLNASRRVSQ